MKKLGFGLMRLPVLNGAPEEIDIEQVKEMSDIFLENGFAYFDTSLSTTTDRAKTPCGRR